MPTNKININHTKTKNQSQQTQHIFLGICIACLHYWSASMNQHCHTRQCQLNLCKGVGRICPWQFWLGLKPKVKRRAGKIVKWWLFGSAPSAEAASPRFESSTVFHSMIMRDWKVCNIERWRVLAPLEVNQLTYCPELCALFQNGDTALHIAAAMGRRKLTKILLESGCDRDAHKYFHKIWYTGNAHKYFHKIWYTGKAHKYFHKIWYK